MSCLDVIEFPSVVTHVARYKFKDRSVIIDLSRVRDNNTPKFDFIAEFIADRCRMYFSSRYILCSTECKGLMYMSDK